MLFGKTTGMICTRRKAIILHNDCTWGQKKPPIPAHTHAELHTMKGTAVLILAAYCLLLINGNEESSRGHDKTYVPISMKGWALTEILLSLVQSITVNRCARHKVLKYSQYQRGKPFFLLASTDYRAIICSVAHQLTFHCLNWKQPKRFKPNVLLRSGLSHPVIFICITLMRLSNLLTQPEATCFQIRLGIVNSMSTNAAW